MRARPYFIPTVDEWYKAAYYKGGGVNAGYWTYRRTQSYRPQATCCLPRGTDNANYRAVERHHLDVHRCGELPDPGGEFCGLARPLWTIPIQGGDLCGMERGRGLIGRAIWGGEWSGSIDMLYSEGRGSGADPTYSYNGCGFRVASRPWGWQTPAMQTVTGRSM